VSNRINTRTRRTVRRLLPATTTRLILLTTLLFCTSSISAEDPLVIRKYLGITPTASELGSLPRYCWGYYSNRKGQPGYVIPKSKCGPGMNHYCGGLLRKNRAESGIGLSSKERFKLYKVALKDFNYTLHWMKEFPACPLRKYAAMHKMTVSARLEALTSSRHK